MYFANLPFPVGHTYKGSATPASTDGAYLEGMEYYVPDYNYASSGPPKLRSGRIRKLRVVRNGVTINSGGDVTTGYLRPKRLVNFKAGTYNGQVDGYARYTAAGPASSTGFGASYPVDEYLPAAGVQPNDLFYIVVEGPATVLTDIAQVVDILVGDPIVSLTAATSGATTSGHAAGAVFTSLTGVPIASPILNAIGRAMSAATSGNTNSDLLVDIRNTLI